MFTSLLGLFSIQTLFLSQETIIPNYIKEKHPSISTLLVSFLISCAELSALFVSLLISNFLEKIGRKNTIVIGFVIFVLGTAFFAITDFIQNATTFYIVAFICRLISGAGDQLIQTTTYSVLSSTFPKSREKILGYGEVAAAIGLMLGPILGGTLNTLLRFMLTYLIFAGVLAFNGLLVFIVMPSSLNNKPEITEQQIDAMS